MEVLHEAQVTPDQIDHLGHMNVRYYATHARTGAERLLASLGCRADDDRTVVQRDSYVRHHREQLVGAPLEVRGGVLDVSGAQIRLYEELRNRDTGDVAASFVLSFGAADPTTRAALPLGDEVAAAAVAKTTTLPDYGAPRSISLDEDVAAGAPTLDVVRAEGLELRQVRPITAAESDPHGFVLPLSVPELIWGGEPMPGREFRPLEELADGAQMGFATMETRATWVRPARTGDRVQSFGAELDLQRKTMLTRNWLFDVDGGDLVAVFSVVNLAFNTRARRSIVIPDEVRRRLEARLHPELG